MKKVILSMLLAFILAFTLVAADGDLTVTVDSASQSEDPGATLTYTLTFSNTGTATIDTVSVTSTDLTDGTNTITAPSIATITALEVGTDQTSTVTLTVPSSMPSGVYTGTITATDAANTANTMDVTYSLVINSVDAYTVSPTDLDFSLLPDTSENEIFDITNTGSTTLTSWILSFTSDDGDIGFVEDNDDDRIDITFSTPSDSLAPGETMTITVTANADEDADEGDEDYSGDITVTGTGVADLSVTMPVSLTIEPEICEDGKVGDAFDVSIQEPDSGDEYGPGDTVTVDVDIENKDDEDLDIEIEVILYNEDEAKKIKTVKETGSVDEDEEESFEIEIEIPTDIDADDTFFLYVQVHEEDNEDDRCDFERVKLDIELEDEDARILEVDVTPSVGLECGDDYLVSVEVESVGDEELENVYVQLKDSDLLLDEESAPFDLGDYNDRDNDFRVTFDDLVVPIDLGEDDYYMEVQLFDEHGSLFDSELVLVELVECSGTSIPSNTPNFRVTVVDEVDVAGEELTLSVLVTNTASTEQRLSISTNSISWGTLDEVEALDVLGPGDEARAYLYFTLDTETVGKHDVQLTFTDSEGQRVTEIVTVDFGEDGIKDATSDSLGGLFENQSKSFWIIANIVLVILALVLLRMLFRRK